MNPMIAYIMEDRDGLLRFIRSRRGSYMGYEDAEDVLQDVTVKLLRLQPEGNPKAYVTSSIKNLLTTRWRRRRRILMVPLDRRGYQDGDTEAEALTRVALEEITSGIRDSDRETVRVYLAGERPTPAQRTLMHRLRKRLRKA